MKNTLALLKTSVLTTIVFAVILCGIYPLLIFGIGQLCFHEKANGSLIKVNGKVIGSKLIGQNFDLPKYFHPRPSAAGNVGYDAGNSSGSNLGPTSQKLINGVKISVNKYRTENQLPAYIAVPGDAATASGSGLDPHISVQNALYQVSRIAKTRGLSEQVVKNLVQKNTERSFLGFIGESRVNVLMLNLQLDGI